MWLFYLEIEGNLKGYFLKTMQKTFSYDYYSYFTVINVRFNVLSFFLSKNVVLFAQRVVNFGAATRCAMISFGIHSWVHLDFSSKLNSCPEKTICSKFKDIIALTPCSCYFDKIVFRISVSRLTAY